MNKKNIIFTCNFGHTITAVLISFVIILLNTQTYGQTTLFQRVIGGTANDDVRSLIQTTDGGYVVAGSTSSFGAGNSDFYIVKFNAGGTLQWNKTVGGIAEDVAVGIIQTTDGGYVVAGSTSSFGAGNLDFYIVKLDTGGILQWSRTVGGTAMDRASSIIQTTDGGYAVCGYTQSFGATGLNDCYIVKLNASGSLQWSRMVGGPGGIYGEDAAYSIIQTTDGGYAVAGETWSFGAGEGDFYIVKLDSNGTPQWSKTIGGTSADDAVSIIQTTDGGYAVTGFAIRAGGYDMYIVKLNNSGTLQWSRTFSASGIDYGTSIVQSTDGGYAIAGRTAPSFSGPFDFYIVKLDSSGTIMWSKTVGGTGNDGANSIIKTMDGGYAVAGWTNSFGSGNNDFYIVKLDGNGITCANSNTPSSNTVTFGTESSPTSLFTSPSSIVNTPLPTASTGGTLTVVCTLTGIQADPKEIPYSYSLSQNYPNPFNPRTIINYELPFTNFVKLAVHDVTGKEVAVLVNDVKNAGTYSVEFDGSSLSSGVYFYKLITSDFTETKRMILLK